MRADRFALACLGLALLTPARSRAHLGSTKLVWITPAEDGATARVELDPIDVAYALEAPELERPAQALSRGDVSQAGGLLARGPQIGAWAARVFRLRSDGGVCEASAAPVTTAPARGLRHRHAVVIRLTFICPEPATALVFRDEAIFDSDRQHEAIVNVGGQPTVLRVGRQEVALETRRGIVATLRTFLLEGAIHLVTGYDHILFLLTLLLAAGGIARREGLRAAVRDVALVVTAFTLGHSITLVAAGLDIVSLPSRWVESAIAASIVIVAGWNLVVYRREPDEAAPPESRGALRAVAGAFGLLHGFGFSSVLRELVSQPGERVAALFAFNVGIELAQLAIVVVTVPWLAWAARRAWYRPVLVFGGSSTIGLVGLYWFVVRAFAL
ncbi:MAG TPA: HupE/UreJ family protein [Polyangiaceae bacterium]|nr:HupE/UreJ family protein [Polyangiaceae bacterium]